MPKNVVSLQYALGPNPYISDAGLNYSVNTRFIAPPDLDDAAVSSIAAAVGATITTEPAVCSDSSSITPRKLRFIRASGNSMSVAYAARLNWITVAQSIIGTLNASAAPNNQVVCLQIEGEQINNLNDELGLVFDGTSTAPTHRAPASALKQNYVSGVITYGADAAATPGSNTTHPIRSITEAADNTFAAQLGAAPTTCIGSLLDVQNCGNGRRNPRKHRRYELQFLTRLDPTDADETAQTESIEVPVASSAVADIFNCGQTLAGLPGVYCIGYKGESFSRAHRLLP